MGHPVAEVSSVARGTLKHSKYSIFLKNRFFAHMLPGQVTHGFPKKNQPVWSMLIGQLKLKYV